MHLIVQLMDRWRCRCTLGVVSCKGHGWFIVLSGMTETRKFDRYIIECMFEGFYSQKKKWRFRFEFSSSLFLLFHFYSCSTFQILCTPWWRDRTRMSCAIRRRWLLNGFRFGDVLASTPPSMQGSGIHFEQPSSRRWTTSLERRATSIIPRFWL